MSLGKLKAAATIYNERATNHMFAASGIVISNAIIYIVSGNDDLFNKLYLTHESCFVFQSHEQQCIL